MCIVSIGLESEPEPSQPMATAQPPSFIKPVANTMVPEGTPARFEAVFSGYPTPDISWIRNGIQTLHSSREYKVTGFVLLTFWNVKYNFKICTHTHIYSSEVWLILRWIFLMIFK